MKHTGRKIYRFALIAAAVWVVMAAACSVAFAETPDGQSVGGTGNPVAGGSPVDNGQGAPSDPAGDVQDPMEECDFIVSGDGEYEFDPEAGILRILSGEVTVRNKGDITSQHIEVAGNSVLVLDGVAIETVEGVLNSPIRILPGVSAELVLNEGTTNVVSGTSLAHDGYKKSGVAGVEVGIDVVDEIVNGKKQEVVKSMATLTISGGGELKATGGTDAAGIGGSKFLSSKSTHGNIIIEDGIITAYGGDGGAGIGTASNKNSELSNGSFKSSSSWGSITINGGTITAVGDGGKIKDPGDDDAIAAGIGDASAAGIGGGNHVDSGNIIINGGTIKAIGYSGIGSGLGSSKYVASKDPETNEYIYDKGPGNYFATVTINGGTITARGRDIGAGIGGAMYCDAIITITGGDVTAYAGAARGKATHGGAAIGGGYQGHAEILITGGDVKAYAGEGSGAAAIGSGTAANSHSLHNSKKDGRSAASKLEQTTVTITGGTVYAEGGGLGGAAIGLGVGSDKGDVTITGGDVTAIGGKSSEQNKAGGAGIGSAYAGRDYSEFNLETGEHPTQKYFVLSDTNISITGGTVLSIGGWGAAGVGSGAQNKMANQIDITAAHPGKTGGAELQAYADGTKFAIDTRILSAVADGGKPVTTSQAVEQPDTRLVDGFVLQGTFVHNYSDSDIQQSPEGLKSIVLTCDGDSVNSPKELALMPEGYRSFGTNVPKEGSYTVYTDDASIGNGEGRYFSTMLTDQYDSAEAEEQGKLIRYEAAANQLSDNFYLYPVKTIVVEKIAESDSEDESLNGLDMTAYFALYKKNDDAPAFVTLDKDPDKIWTEKIKILRGVPQGKAYFVNVKDADYDVCEIDKEYTVDEMNAVMAAYDGGKKQYAASPKGHSFGSYTLKDIQTSHQGGADNNGTISDDQWTDQVTVRNIFTVEEPDEPTGGQGAGLLRISKTLGSGSAAVRIPRDTVFTISGPLTYNNGQPKTITYNDFTSGMGNQVYEEMVPQGTYVVTEDTDSAAVEGHVLFKTEYIVGDQKFSDKGIVTIFENDSRNLTDQLIKIENSYRRDVADLTISKAIPQYFDASGTSNATAVFKVVVYRTAGAPMTEYYAFDFTKAGEQKQTIQLKDASTLVKAEITEVYGAGYDPQGGETKVIDLTDAGMEPFEVSFDNRYDTSKVTQSAGIINQYVSREYKRHSLLNLIGE